MATSKKDQEQEQEQTEQPAEPDDRTDWERAQEVGKALADERTKSEKVRADADKARAEKNKEK